MKKINDIYSLKLKKIDCKKIYNEIYKEVKNKPSYIGGPTIEKGLSMYKERHNCDFDIIGLHQIGNGKCFQSARFTTSQLPKKLQKHFEKNNDNKKTPVLSEKDITKDSTDLWQTMQQSIMMERDVYQKFKNTIYIRVKRKSPRGDYAHRVYYDYDSYKNTIHSSESYYINLDPKTYDARYVARFLSSPLGYIILGKMVSDPLTQKDVQVIPIPNIPLSKQKTISENIETLDKIEFNLRKIKRNILTQTKPINTNSIFDNLPNIQIEKLLDNDESITHELKSSLRYCLKTEKHEKYITHACLKTICAFLNTEGGSLLIGVRDNKTISGIDIDGFSNIDEYERFLSDKIRDHLGVEFLMHITMEFIPINGKKVCHVRLSKLDKNSRCCLDGEIYIRMGPSSRKLNSEETADWMEGRLK